MSNTTGLQSYELMVIFTPVLSEDEFKNSCKKLAGFVAENGGQVVKENQWGLRSLAYPIEKKTTGMYLVLEFSIAAEMISKFEVMMNRDENIMRHMTNRLDKYAVEYNNKKRSTTTEETASKTVEA